jgi:hypothetical protein
MEWLARTFGEHISVPLQGPSKREAIDQTISDLCRVELCNMAGAVVEARVGSLSIPDAVTFQESAISFHHERPIRPNRTGGLDPISNVEQGVDGYRAGGDPLLVALIEDPE